MSTELVRKRTNWATYVDNFTNPLESINVEVTYEEGGAWHKVRAAKESILWAIMRERMNKELQDTPFFSVLIAPSNYFCDWHAIRFPSGAIYDFVLARRKDFARRLAWR